MTYSKNAITMALLASLTLVGCSGEDDSNDSSSKPTKYTDTDVTFVSESYTVSESSGTFDLVVKLTEVTERDVKVPFVLSGLATNGTDYTLNTSSPITISAGKDEALISFSIENDSLPEGGESITVGLNTPTNASLGAVKVATITIPGDLGLNDTGVVTWFDGATFTDTTSNSAYPNQDADYGQDYENGAINYDGASGFSFTKLDSSGNALASSTVSFTCVRDNRTGLVWEVKQPAQTLPVNTGDDLDDELKTYPDENPYPYSSANYYWRASNYVYYWYNDNDAKNGGAEGTKSDYKLDSDWQISELCAYRNRDQDGYSRGSKYCNSESLIKTVNNLSMCGYKDWRLASIDEMTSIHNYRGSASEPGEVEYFGNTASGDYITGTPYANATGAAWCVNSDNGQVKLCNKQTPHYIRLVRGDAQ